MWHGQKERKIITKIVDTSFRCNTLGQRTHFARTKKLPLAGGVITILDVTVAILNVTVAILDVTVAIMDVTVAKLDVTVAKPDVPVAILDVTVAIL